MFVMTNVCIDNRMREGRALVPKCAKGGPHYNPGTTLGFWNRVDW